jgi:hypothetical protein
MFEDSFQRHGAGFLPFLLPKVSPERNGVRRNHASHVAENTDVFIVDAGPTGLVLAVWLTHEQSECGVAGE